MGWFNHHLVLFHHFNHNNSHGEDSYTTTVDGSELPRPIHRLDGAKTRPEMMVDKLYTFPSTGFQVKLHVLVG